MGAFVGALVEIAAPGLAGNWAKRTNIMFQERERDEEAQSPNQRDRDLRLHFWRQRGSDLNGLPQRGRDFGELFEPARDTLRIHDVAAEERPAAVEFEVEVPEGGTANLKAEIK